MSSRGWAFGYLGGGVLLVVNLVMFLFHDTFGMSEGFAVRLSMLSAALWWAGFTFIPYLRLHNQPPENVVAESGGLVSQSFGQLAHTLKDLRNYPVAVTFLVAYLFFNDGIQTVIASSSTYGSEQLGFGQTILIATILLVQFVAFFGALVFGRAAATVRRQAGDPVRPGDLDGDRDGGAVPPGGVGRPVPAPRGRDRHRPGRHPGPGPVLLLAADPAGQGGGVLQLLPRDGPRHLVVRHASCSASSTSSRGPTGRRSSR